MIDPLIIRQDFPIFHHHPTLAYLDNAATMQKPETVIRGVANFYRRENANIHRGVYPLAVQATEKYEQVRHLVASLIGAPSSQSIVYTAGTTAGINLVVQSFLEKRLCKGDEVLITAMEHHANLIPWQMVCKKQGARLVIIPMNAKGELDMQAFKERLSKRTKMVAAVHISNTLGSINPIEEIVARAHKKGIPVLIDGAQSAAHYPIDVEDIDCDFFVFSGHKVFGPTGIGVLYGKEEHLGDMQPVYFGGDMIRDVSFEDTIFAEHPQKFEAGTTNIAGIIGLGYAMTYLQQYKKAQIVKYLNELGAYAEQELNSIKGLKLVGRAKRKSPILSFHFKNIHPHDVATFLGAENIAIRAGHHCTQPLMDIFDIPGTSRASFTFYNTFEEVDRMVKVLIDMKKFLS
jgi:cysteine desulfurase/selenocysteine lyase